MSPTKFGKGVGLLWRGCELGNISSFFATYLFFRKKKSSKQHLQADIYLFESARSALYLFLQSLEHTENNKVIVSSFTCEAVIYAIVKAGYIPVYIDVNNDMTMNDQFVIDNIDDQTKVVIMQNTFGRRGLDLSTIKYLKTNDIVLIEDCALSIGSKINNKPLGTFGDASVYSLEASKTITTGWGGVFFINNKLLVEDFNKLFYKAKTISLLADIRRLTQLWTSVLMVNINKPYYFPLWYFLYGTRIFRVSNKFYDIDPLLGRRMGILTEKFFCETYSKLLSMFSKASANYNELALHAINQGVLPLIEQKDEEFIVSPRISFLIDAKYHARVFAHAESLEVEVGRWFSEVPPNLYLDKAIENNCVNARKISKNIINFSSHYTLSSNDLKKIKLMIEYIASLVTVEKC